MFYFINNQNTKQKLGATFKSEDGQRLNFANSILWQGHAKIGTYSWESNVASSVSICGHITFDPLVC